MTHEYEYYSYRRGNAVISLRDRGQAPVGFVHDAVKQRIRDTLDILPESHINLFGTTGVVELRVITRDGESRGGGGHIPLIPQINLSYKCLDGSHSYNSGDLSYTLLHEMGHIVDKSIRHNCMRALKREFPLGCLAILTRYHGGGTLGTSEHYADIYADYFYKELARLSYNVNRTVRSRTTCGCGGCNAWVTRLSRREWGNLPTSSGELTALRYEALFRSPPFVGISRQSPPPLPNNQPETSGVSEHASLRIPSHIIDSILREF